jgi:ComF family protein
MLLVKRLHRCFNAIKFIFFPIQCISCNELLHEYEHILCMDCKLSFPYTNDYADNPVQLRLSGRIQIAHALALAHFYKNGMLQILLHEYKYRGNLTIGAFLAKELAHRLTQQSWIHEIDAISFVPLHEIKLKERGFDQASFIAQQIAQELKIPLVLLLRRIANTASQTHKDRLARLENMKDAFEMIDTIGGSYKHILILDDVLTTGATLEACVHALNKNQLCKVSIATIGVAMD